MHYSMRPASQQDKEIQRSLHRTLKPYIEDIWGWNDAEQRSIFDKRYDPQDLQMILSSTGHVIGSLQVKYTDSDIFIASILIAQDYQRQGLGTKILLTLIESAKKSAKDITLTVLRPNPAVELYKRLGFVVEKEDEIRRHMRYSVV